MKSINKYISERLQISSKGKYNDKKYPDYFPKTKEELQGIIRLKIKDISNRDKSNTLIDLNDIDVSEITDMSELFRGIYIKHIDISKWDVGSVTNFYSMFGYDENYSYIESIGDISNWDMHSAETLQAMFYRCERLESIGDISKWNVSNVNTMCTMFCYCKELKNIGDISKWDVSKVANTRSMFFDCRNLYDVGDLNNWNISKKLDYDDMFKNSYIKTRPNWYKGKV